MLDPIMDMHGILIGDAWFYSGTTVAKKFGKGRNKMYEWLRGQLWLDINNQPTSLCNGHIKLVAPYRKVPDFKFEKSYVPFFDGEAVGYILKNMKTVTKKTKRIQHVSNQKLQEWAIDWSSI